MPRCARRHRAPAPAQGRQCVRSPHAPVQAGLRWPARVPGAGRGCQRAAGLRARPGLPGAAQPGHRPAQRTRAARTAGRAGRGLHHRLRAVAWPAAGGRYAGPRDRRCGAAVDGDAAGWAGRALRHAGVPASGGLRVRHRYRPRYPARAG
ncbi:hypothetical protein G6F23_013983 [Rhizopus arrhizus]|nr:hypothetical protein G6F23_013983 [Rhizopus arrhizus]